MNRVLTVIFLAVSVLCVMHLSGCEEPFMYDTSAAGYRMMSNDPSYSAKQREAAGYLSVLMRNEAQRLHERNLAQGQGGR